MSEESNSKKPNPLNRAHDRFKSFKDKVVDFTHAGKMMIDTSGKRKERNELLLELGVKVIKLNQAGSLTHPEINALITKIEVINEEIQSAKIQ